MVRERFNIFTKLRKTVVISRYNESLEWLKRIHFSPEYSIIIYNKGTNTLFYKPENARIIPLPNIGRCDHTYLYHITTHYDSLDDIVIFLPGCCGTPYKFNTMKCMLQHLEKTQRGIFPGIEKRKDLKKELYHFSITEWNSTTSENYEANPERQLTPANIRPFGKWFDYHFGDKRVTANQLWGIFSISKHDILQHSQSYYQTLVNDFGKSSNPEVGHYFERSWVAVFGPFRYTIII